MKRWKMITLATFLCLNILVCYFTVSLLYRRPVPASKDQVNGGHAAREGKPALDTVHLMRDTDDRPAGSILGPRVQDNTQIRHMYSSKRDSLDLGRSGLLEFLSKPKDDLCSSATKLLVAVCSSVDHFERRDVIRSTWGNQTILDLFKVVVVFIVALPEPHNEHLQSYVTQEASTYGDVVQLNHTDHYKNLTLKSLGMLRWTQQHCVIAEVLLKTDDDIFLNVPNLLHLLDEPSFAGKTNFILGSIIQDAQPVRDRMSKWFTPYSVYRGDVYPPYTSGTAYLMSRDVIVRLYAQSEDHPMYWLEDIFLTGILARELEVELIHDGRFNYRKTKRKDRCWYSTAFTEHDLSPLELSAIWKTVVVDSARNSWRWTDCQINLENLSNKSS